MNLPESSARLLRRGSVHGASTTKAVLPNLLVNSLQTRAGSHAWSTLLCQYHAQLGYLSLAMRGLGQNQLLQKLLPRSLAALLSPLKSWAPLGNPELIASPWAGRGSPTGSVSQSLSVATSLVDFATTRTLPCWASVWKPCPKARGGQVLQHSSPMASKGHGRGS